MRPQSSVGFGETYLQAEEFRQNYVLFSCGSQCNASTCFNETRGARIRKSIQEHISTHDEQKRHKLRWIGYFANTQEPTVVRTANGKVQTHEEAQVFVQDLNLFVTVQLLDSTPAVLSLEKLCEDTDTLMSGSAVKSHGWPKTGRVSSARQTISHLLSFQGCPPFLKAARLLHRYHRTRWEEKRNKHPGNWCNLLQVHLQYQSEVTN